MNLNKLNNSNLQAKIAIVALDGVEQSELVDPRDAFRAAGAEVLVLSLKTGNLKGWQNGDWGLNIPVDGMLSDHESKDFDALILPGGTLNGDKIRQEPAVVNFTQDFLKEGKVVGAICHGVQVLIEAGGISGRKMTSAKGIRTDVENAGAIWVDQAAVSDGGMVTSRNPHDIPAFVNKVREEILEQRRRGRKAA
jgi:protease I